MSIRRKELRSQRKEPLGLELIATFPRPPPGPRSPARLSLQSPGLTPRPSNYGFIPFGPANNYTDTDTDSLYDEPGPPPPPRAQFAQTSAPIPAPPSNHNTELQLVLDHPSKVFAPGDWITGYIIGWSTAEEHIHIIFSGQTTTKIQDPKTTHTNHTPLVFQTTHLKPGAQTPIPRFEFLIPHLCEFPPADLNDITQGHEAGKSYWTTGWPNQNPFEDKAGHPLPPSMYMGPRSVSKLSNIQGSASTAYSLVAIRSTSDPSTHKLIPNATFHYPITLTTLRLAVSKLTLLKGEQHHMTSNLSVQTAALAKERKLRLREQFCDAFNTAAPTFYFSVKASAPRLSMPGASLKMSLTMDVLAPPPGKLYNFPIPDITVASMTFVVRSYTGIRTLLPAHVASQADINSPEMPVRRETLKNVEIRAMQTPANATFAPQKGAFEDQVCIASITLPKDVLPSFKTYSAWRGYRLECVIKLRVAGKDVEAKFADDLDVVAGGDMKVERAMVPADDGMSRRVAEAFVRTSVSG
ncbi:uncharacterized protein N0V89_009980 [Didymosphaeria variabile]|uniref:Arrestin-like N-terminal domain-containing protein n=1 Tax=Didymosphaeria variabile TaxID=1932322 RepID=A0A9W8XEV9_9PLEO|nr:uncharacterized protein N0V89_009980 [Didymosphaeria variabile]KAJ4348602.1 hypothetical protein N0V89_009980 [Didymosphaeria variabile]